jgi:insertion element IS1 protein InsB
MSRPVFTIIAPVSVYHRVSYVETYSRSKWGAYTRHLDPEQHTVSKRGTQKIERQHLTLRTRIKRLVRKTICFSKSTRMHDIVIGLFVNRYAFGRAV